jgi:glycosyltransferase involved in cell wall biosynthesis
MDLLRDTDVELHIAGDGPDLNELLARCRHLGDRVRYLGVIPPREIPRLLAEYDVFLFPTRIEGLGYVLLESLAAGCVPVSSRIRGVTDFVVKQDETGLLFPVHDAKAAADCVRRLARDRDLLGRLSDAGRVDCQQRFNISDGGNAYAKLFNSLKESQPVAAPLPMSQWKLPKEFARGWRAFIPARLKNAIRAWSA